MNWNLDPSHSEVTFKVKHMMIANVTGVIGKFDVKVTSSDENFSDAQIEFNGDLSSISTGDAQRDGHLKTPDFFNIEKYPHLVFRSTSFAGNKLKGDLTINDVTKPIELDVENGGTGKDPWGNARQGFTVTGKISRKDWNLVWNAPLETGGFLVSDDVKINAEIQLIKA
ncbi:MAG: YceI family protein [Flavobacteriales bacterium]|nr:YceI family protein [Flavobacteriales bacterium]